MDNLYKKHFENLLFERKFLYMSKTPKGSPGATPPKSPKQTVDQVPPTEQDVRDRIKFVRDSFQSMKNKPKGKQLFKKLKSIEDRLNQMQSDREEAKKQVIKSTSQNINKIIKRTGLTYTPLSATLSKTAKGSRPQVTNPNSAVNYPKGIDPTQPQAKPKSKSGSKVEKKEVESKYKVSIGDVVNHKIKVLQDHLYNFVQGMKKRTKMSTSQIKLSSEYKEISKVISESQKQVSKIAKMKIKIPGIYDKDIGKARTKLKLLRGKKPMVERKVEAAEENLRLELKLKDSYSYKEKEPEYKKVNAKIKAVAKKYNVDVPAYKPPTAKTVLALIKNMRANLKNIADPKLRKAAAQRLKNQEAFIIMISNPNDKTFDSKNRGQALSEIFTEKTKMLKKWQAQYNLQEDPFHEGIDAGPAGKPKGGPKSAAKAGPTKAKSTPIQGPGRVEIKDLKSENERGLVKGLRDLEHGTGNFETTMGTVNRIIKRMGIRPGNDINKISTQALPDGYEVGMINWPKSKGKNYDSYPNLVIYRNGKIVCFRTGTSETGTSLQTPAQASPRDLKVAQIIKGHAVINNLRSKNSTEVKGSMKLNSVAKMEELKTTLRDFARSAVMPSSTRFGYGLVIDAGGTSVYFKNKGGGHGEFKIRMGQSVYFYDTRGDKIGTAKFDKKGKVIDKGYSNELGVMSKNEKKVLDNKRETAKKAKEKAAKFKKERFETKSSLRDPNNKLIKYDKEKGNEFTLSTNGKPPNRAEKKFLKQKINGVINFNRVLDKFLYITIKGAKNRPERKALYTPGSKTAYVLDKQGVMTSKRVRFYNGDRFKLEYKSANMRSVKSENRKVVRERMEVGKRMKKLVSGKVKKGADKRKMAALKRLMSGTPPRAMRGKTNRRKFIALADQVISTEKTTKKKQKPKATKG